MRMRWSGIWFLVLLLGLVGCRSRVTTTAEGEAAEDTTTHLNDKTDIVLADWLQLPRAEQAKLVDEWTVTVQKMLQEARSKVESVQLLPRLCPPVVSAVFAEAKFSPSAGFSLPPYVKEGQKDAAVTLHLARFGDHEAALKLADPNDKELLAKIDACRGERNYPLEWTRLVALMLQNAELKLANGDADGASELVLLHRELRSLLDAKAASGALGAALLPRGRQALTQAAAAWREPTRNKIALADDINAALADWGPLPDAVPGLNLGANKSEVVAFMGGKAEKRAVAARTPSAVQRTLDLLALPLPSEGTEGVLAFLDDKETLTEWLVLYRPKLSALFPEPRQLALPLVERDYTSAEPTTTPGLTRQSWSGGGWTYRVALLTRGQVGGAVARIGKSGEPNRTKEITRDFGVVHLDRTFEQNRLGVKADQVGSALEIKDVANLARVVQPAAQCALASAVLQREAKEDLLARMTLNWPMDRNSNALGQLALPLWAAFGPAPLESAEEAGGGSFILTWKDEATRVKLNLPFEDKAPQLIVEDSRGDSALKARRETAEAFDRRERQERLAAGKPHQRLPRVVPLPSHGIDDLHLGMTREQVKAILPHVRSVRVQPLSDGLNVLFLDEAPAKATHWPHQLFVRFDKSNRVAEIRVRYQIGPQASGPKAPSLLDTLKAKTNAAPQELPAPWAALWTDLPARKPLHFYRWLDDVTCLTYQRDSGGSEVVYRDCPPEQPHGVELPPLLFCRTGVPGCNLGDSQAEVRKRLSVRSPVFASNGAEVMRMPSNSPYDILFVSYENGKVSQVIARHREPATLKKADVTVALRQAWGADVDRLGFIRRQDDTRGQVVQAYGYHDDRTRVRLFAQETEEGIRLFTEWRAWPIPTKMLASK